MNPQLTQVFELTLSEKLQLVEDLWDSIASDSDRIPVLDTIPASASDTKMSRYVINILATLFVVNTNDKCL